MTTEKRITALTDLWYRIVGLDHHKDRDCHFVIEKRWSYGKNPRYVVRHYGYVGPEIESKPFLSSKEAAEFLEETLWTMVGDRMKSVKGSDYFDRGQIKEISQEFKDLQKRQ